MATFNSAPALEGESMTLRMWMSNQHAGTVIGKGGVNIKGVREQSTCKVSIADMVPGSSERLVSIIGAAMSISLAMELMLDVLEAATKDSDKEDPASLTAEGALSHSLKLVMSNNQVGGVIGKGGATIKSMREESGAAIKVESASTMQNERLALISGSKVSCVKAVTLLASKLATMPDDGTSAPAKFQKTGLPSPAGRGGFPGGQYQNGPGYPGYGAPPASFPGGYPQGPPGGYGAPGSQPQSGFAGQPQPGQGFPAGQGYPGQYPPPQQGYAQQGYAGFGVEGGHGQYGGAGGAAAASGPSGSMEQLVPAALVGRLIGKGGAGIKELREMTQASIKVNSDSEPGTDQRKVIVSGTPEQTQMALALIQQRLAMGP